MQNGREASGCLWQPRAAYAHRCHQTDTAQSAQQRQTQGTGASEPTPHIHSASPSSKQGGNRSQQESKRTTKPVFNFPFWEIQTVTTKKKKGTTMSSQQQQQQQQEGSKTPGDSIRQGSGVLCTYLTLVPFHLLDDSFFISINHVQAPLFFVCVFALFCLFALHFRLH